MKFGSVTLSELSQIVWEMPADPPATQSLLDSLPTCTEVPRIYIGCSMWIDRGFLGKIYPRGTPAKGFLKAYCRHFNTVELNTTFYHIPSVEQVKKWKETATPGFRFCPKVPRSISHRRELDTQIRFLDIFIETVLHFESTLGMTFLQLPPYSQPGNVSALQRLLMHVPLGFQLAVELRHPAWFRDMVASQELFGFLEERGLVAVITDVAGRRDVLHQSLTTNCAFIRFVGNNLHSTDYTRIDIWIEKLRQWFEKGLSTVYFLLHEPEKALCVDLAAYMIQQLNALEGIRVALPKLERDQTSLFFAV